MSRIIFIEGFLFGAIAALAAVTAAVGVLWLIFRFRKDDDD